MFQRLTRGRDEDRLGVAVSPPVIKTDGIMDHFSDTPNGRSCQI